MDALDEAAAPVIEEMRLQPVAIVPDGIDIAVRQQEFRREAEPFGLHDAIDGNVAEMKLLHEFPPVAGIGSKRCGWPYTA